MSEKDFNLRLYNTLGRKVQDFISIEPNKARLYACGPTVYANLTIGNFRTYIFEDVSRKFFSNFTHCIFKIILCCNKMLGRINPKLFK